MFRRRMAFPLRLFYILYFTCPCFQEWAICLVVSTPFTQKEPRQRNATFSALLCCWYPSGPSYWMSCSQLCCADRLPSRSPFDLTLWAWLRVAYCVYSQTVGYWCPLYWDRWSYLIHTTWCWQRLILLDIWWSCSPQRLWLWTDSWYSSCPRWAVASNKGIMRYFRASSC